MRFILTLILEIQEIFNFELPPAFAGISEMD
ncbi:hypothetical protein L1276_002298 [Flavobacterium sp. HSC-32F16]|nr:hypothetical protein [Flavobacterium sp. HSC-32F16]